MLHRPRNIMRQAVFSVIVLAAGSAPGMAADPTGDWKVADGVANIRVAQCNGNMWGAVSWEKEADFRLPVRVWKEMMDVYYPNSAWINLRKDVFDRFYQYKMRMGMPTWEHALESLLAQAEKPVLP